MSDDLRKDSGYHVEKLRDIASILSDSNDRKPTLYAAANHMASMAARIEKLEQALESAANLEMAARKRAINFEGRAEAAETALVEAQEREKSLAGDLQWVRARAWDHAEAHLEAAQQHSVEGNQSDERHQIKLHANWLDVYNKLAALTPAPKPDTSVGDALVETAYFNQPQEPAPEHTLPDGWETNSPAVNAILRPKRGGEDG